MAEVAIRPIAIIDDGAGTGGTQLRIGFDTSNYLDVQVADDGVVTFTGQGANTSFEFARPTTFAQDVTLQGDILSAASMKIDVGAGNTLTLTRAVSLGSTLVVGGTSTLTGRVGVGGAPASAGIPLAIYDAATPRFRFIEGSTFRGEIGHDDGTGKIMTGAPDNWLVIRGDAGVILGAGNARHVNLLTDGTLGIGHASPAAKLHVQAGSAASLLYALHLENGDTTNDSAAVGLVFSTGNDSYQKGAIVYHKRSTFGRGDMRFLQNSTADTSAAALSNAAMTLLNNGVLILGSGSAAGSALPGGIRVPGASQFDAALTLSGGLVSYGANDSAGAGFRTVRVPNA